MRQMIFEFYNSMIDCHIKQKVILFVEIEVTVYFCAPIALFLSCIIIIVVV